MAVQIVWQNNEHTILRYNFVGRWGWDEYFTLLAQGRQMMKQEDHWVCILNDFSTTTFLPDNFLSKARNISNTRPLNTGRVVFITNQSFLVKLLSIMGQLSPDWATHYYHEPNETQAIAHLQRWLQDQPQP